MSNNTKNNIADNIADNTKNNIADNIADNTKNNDTDNTKNNDTDNTKNSITLDMFLSDNLTDNTKSKIIKSKYPVRDKDTGDILEYRYSFTFTPEAKQALKDTRFRGLKLNKTRIEALKECKELRDTFFKELDKYNVNYNILDMYLSSDK